MKIQSVRGTHDLYAQQLEKFKFIIEIVNTYAHIYDFNEIITPIFEFTELFLKPLGENSDVVLKEMYTFDDRNDSSLTLRPEYTTPIIRAAISNNLLERLPTKLYGIGPMFRRERPQKGRFRQFNQINFEILGTNDMAADAELILLADDILKKIFLNKKIKLEINSLGDKDTLKKFKNNLSVYFKKYKSKLSLDAQNRIESNPLRILDSKNKNDNEICQEAPKISDFYSKEAKNKFEEIKNLLSNYSIEFEVNPNLVRGLDYYCHTVFEFKSNELGSQDTLIGGGRYDGLTKILGGPDIPGVGWAGGVERIMMLIEEDIKVQQKTHLIVMKEDFRSYGLNILNKLRKNNIPVFFDYKYNLKKSLSFASNVNARYAIIIGEEEVKNHSYTIKDLKKNTQKTILFDSLISFLKA